MAVLASLILLVFLIRKSSTVNGRLFILENKKTIYWGSVMGIFAYSLYLSYVQYQAWSFGGISQYLLPPYREIDYFLFYSLMRIFAPYILSFIFSLGLLYLLPRLNKRYGDNFFEKEEPYLAALSIFLTGHPGWIFYSLIILLFYLGNHLYHLFKGEKDVRLPLYHIWLWVGVVSILLSVYVLPKTPMWLLLKI